MVRRQKAEGGRQKAEGRRRKAEGGRQKAEAEAEGFSIFHFPVSIYHLSFGTAVKCLGEH